MVTTTGVRPDLEPQSASLSTAAQTNWRRIGSSSTARVLVCLDLVVIWLCAGAVLWFRFHKPGSILAAISGGTALAKHCAFLLLYSVLVILFAHVQRLYREMPFGDTSREVFGVIKAVAVSTLILSTSVYLSGQRIISRLAVGWTVVASLLALVIWRYCWRGYCERLAREGVSTRHILIIGDGWSGSALERYLADNPQLGYVVCGTVSGDGSGPAVFENRPATSGAAIHFLSKASELKEIIGVRFIDDVFVALPVDSEFVKAVVSTARECGVTVRIIPDLYDGMAWGAPIDYVGWFPTIRVHMKRAPELALFMKRALDLAAAGFGLVVLSPAFLAIAAAIRLDSRGPIFYGSERVGRKGRSFTCYKFRTMVENAEGLKGELEHLNERSGILFKIANDPRITRIGRFLRKYSLDELPQLWNVLKGEMSLVGPRPPMPSEYVQYELEHLKRLDVIPGITGLWQVEARRDPSFESYVNLDTYYVEHWGLLLDFRILLKTIRVVVAGTGQ